MNISSKLQQIKLIGKMELILDLKGLKKTKKFWKELETMFNEYQKEYESLKNENN